MQLRAANAAFADFPGLAARQPGLFSMASVIFLLRHGDAEPDQGAGDAARRLTDKGRRQADAAGRAIARLGVGIDACLASPRIRARATAEIACNHLGVVPEIVDSIGTGEYDTLDLAGGRRQVMIVGHEPVLSEETARLTGANIRLKKGGLVILEPNLLRVLLRPRELEAIAFPA
jgi:phosphohistidine phosphatase